MKFTIEKKKLEDNIIYFPNLGIPTTSKHDDCVGYQEYKEDSVLKFYPKTNRQVVNL